MVAAPKKLGLAVSAPIPNSPELEIIGVVRRDKKIVPLNIVKIRKVVHWACEGLEANAIALEAALKTRLRNGVTTREIQDNLIDCALQMCSPEEPDWRYVAGRLHIWSLWKDTQVHRGYQYSDFCRTVQAKIEAGIYNPCLLSYSEAELTEAGSWINPDWDLDYDYAGAVLLSKRYLLDNELPQEAFLITALVLAQPERKENRLGWAKKFYEKVAQRKISLATPLLANSRSSGKSLTSCFITAMEDNLESIYSELTNVARISKNGGGAGVNVSRIRATGSWVMGNPNNSKGVIPWLKLLNDTAIAVDQGGKRAGAITASLDIWHLDVPEFLEMQTENGEQRRKAYDLFPQVVATDEFMRRVVNRGEWTLFDPYEVRQKFGIELAELWGEEFSESYRYLESQTDPDGALDLNNPKITLYKTVSARELFKDIMRSQVETGMPYIAFKDTINKANPNKHEGYIPGANLCTESWSNVVPGKYAHCCNLNSLNLANIEDEELPEVCQIAVRLLDNSIAISTSPFPESEAHNNRYRTIGVGAMGLADWLAKNKLFYTDLDAINYLFDDISYYCTHASMELAKERGAYPAFLGSEWSKGKLLGGQEIAEIMARSHSPSRWFELCEAIIKHGIRNSHIMSIAPNTSSSLIQGCTASHLPPFNLFFYDKWAKGFVPIAVPFLKDCQWYYKINNHIDQKIVVRATATMQKWVDTGISMELNFNLNPGIYYPEDPNRSIQAKEVFDTLILAWQSGCKAIYYIRTIQKDSYQEENCVACAN